MNRTIRGTIRSSAGRSRLFRRLRCRRCLITRQCLQDRACPGDDAGAKLAGAKRRKNDVLDDQPGSRIGQRALEAVTDLDPDFSLPRRDDEECPGVFVLGADPPVTAELIPVVFDRPIAQRFEGDDDDLLPG